MCVFGCKNVCVWFLSVCVLTLGVLGESGCGTLEWSGWEGGGAMAWRAAGTSETPHATGPALRPHLKDYEQKSRNQIRSQTVTVD